MSEEQDLAERWGFHLRGLMPGEEYPYEHIRGHYRVPMFNAGLLETASERPLTFRLTQLGIAVRDVPAPPNP